MLLYIIYNQVISLSYLEQIGGTPPRKVNLRSQSQKGKKSLLDLNQKSKLMSEIFHNP